MQLARAWPAGKARQDKKKRHSLGVFSLMIAAQRGHEPLGTFPLTVAIRRHDIHVKRIRGLENESYTTKLAINTVAAMNPGV